MKKYKPKAAKWFAIFTLLSLLVLVTGITLILLGISSLSMQIFLTAIGGVMSILFLLCLFSVNSSVLEISEKTISLPRSVKINGKKVFQKTVIPKDNIKQIESNFFKGDGLISRNCFFHTIILKNGTRITFTLYEYGNSAEKEILEKMKKASHDSAFPARQYK